MTPPCPTRRSSDLATFAEIHRAWLENHVIVVRGQDMTPEHHIAFAQRWGKIHRHPFNAPMAGYPDIIEIVKRETDTYNHGGRWHRSEEHTSELQSLMRISYAVFCLKKKTNK